MLNTQWLNTFLVLVETGHFTHTAEKLFMTQPGVSQHIKKLEAQTGTLLLKRIGKRFELTPAGESLYRYGVQRQSDDMQLLKSLVEDEPYRGECYIACSGSLAMFLYPLFLAHQKEHNELSIHLEAAPNRVVIENLKSNQTELGIVTQPVSDPNIDQEEIGVESLCLVVPSTYPSDTFSMEALYQFGFISHPDGKHYLQQIHQANTDDAFDFNKVTINGYINQLSQILLPVSQGLGFTVLPEKAVTSFPSPSEIKTIPLPTPVTQKLFLIKKKHRKLGKRYQFFISKIRSTL
ncbi:LysR family transcriptional regulator [Photobacterium sanctipauli]|uniref:LysR family transcriptional regulator n=1 Tax=Photobacterium sanctipauli TaxID=1342794 RepID=A0A2T3NV04_9GAMM|nr:LysR family transcriptional regulator [Photobacterium sanctipauli]PSW20104.1 LysR family transcriptional regulator [Photobacterium sanctipauli]